MKLEMAERVAQRVMGELRPACVRCEVGGSVRRCKPVVKDLEIVFIPQMITRQVDMFNSVQVQATDEVIERLVEAGVLAWDEVVKRHGPLYKRLVHVGSGLVVELFAALEENWGLIWALRTGPGEFNRLLVSHSWQGGAMPTEMRMEGGFLWRNGVRVETPTEEIFFREMGLPYWEPQERSAAVLNVFLASRKKMTSAELWFRGR